MTNDLVIKEPKVAYRVWTVTDYTNDLYSITADTNDNSRAKYNPRHIMTAVCQCNQKNRNDKDLSPCHSYAGGTCGIYAFKKLKDATGYFSRIITLVEIDSNHGNLKFIFGSVNLWGKIQEHKNGFRAQFAYPKSFLLHHRYPPKYCVENQVIKQFSDDWAVEIEYGDVWGK